MTIALSVCCLSSAQTGYDVTVVSIENPLMYVGASELTNDNVVTGRVTASEYSTKRNQWIDRACFWARGEWIISQDWPRSYVAAVNERGAAVGMVADANYQTAYAAIFSVADGRVMQTFRLQGYTSPYGVNDLGWVVGKEIVGWGYGTSFARGGERDFLYRDGAATYMPRLPRMNEGSPVDVNNAGLVVGMGYIGENYVAWYWTDLTSTQRMFPDIPFSWVADLNNLGQAVGFHSRGAFLWQNGAWRGLPQMREPWAINDRGEILGYDSSSRWLVLLPNERRMLNDLFDRSGGYVRVDRAHDINDRGQVLALLQHADGHYAWVILTPRE